MHSLTFPGDHKLHLPINPINPLIHMATERPWLLSRFDHSVRLWQLGQGATSKEADYANSRLGDPLALTESYRVLLEVQLQDEDNLLASAISPNGQWIAVATIEQVKLFRILPHLLIATPDYHVAMVDLTKADSNAFPYTLSALPLVESSLPYGNHRGRATIRSLAVSPNGQWAAVGDIMNRIHVYSLADGLQYHGMLPVFHSIHTSCTFHPDGRRLFVVLANYTMHVYDVEARELNSKRAPGKASMTDASVARMAAALGELPKALQESRDHVLGVLFDPKDANLILLWGSQFIGRIFLDRQLTAKHKQPTSSSMTLAVKRKRAYNNNNGKQGHHRGGSRNTADEKSAAAATTSDALAVVSRYQSLLNVSIVGHHKVMVVERPLHHILQQLPASFYEPGYNA
ncbi:hypothetical protein SYNPS1DRAFT_22860 [Syncephalis pseudoplumigaleata]|uniref:WD40-repeat-containing domain protein n=1 Tax=Syncephalis pseudoplumigaleata TaxID=1712513 RepID=A0A4P9YYA8_9FUNG|nr:hypothetical protein SYNPS1DRAFT_22860 [Syncephalis pseudoplumigaleata]|eukprot:RKP25133.1 hypothetical protein SYNPS1DRAFT_22860 [Syncephalis pseudoplumigaleata]